MIGLTILAGLIVWLALAILITKFILRRLSATSYPITRCAAIFTLVLTAPFWDEIAGNIYMANALCPNATSLKIISSIDAVKRATAVRNPNQTIWFGMPIEKIQINYIDSDTNETFAYSRSYITHGGWIMRSGLNLGNFSGCGQWATSTHYYHDAQNPLRLKLDQLLKSGESK